MKHLELHILQSVPVSCMNRDDLGSPKTAIFGGVQRARVSSQCWKSAIREYARNESPELFNGIRTKLFIEPLKEKFIEKGKMTDKEAFEVAKTVADAIASFDKENMVKTLYYTSKSELNKMVDVYLSESESEKNDGKTKSDPVKKVLKMLSSKNIADMADIALFGRMVANEPSLRIDGAAMFNHALSTHKVDNEIDFYTAIDDYKKEDEQGAGMMGTLEFNSATYYRFAGLNIDLLRNNLAGMTKEQIEEVISIFIKSTLLSVPIARKNSMNANTLPGYILIVGRNSGHPIQLINAFENPVYRFQGKSVFEKSKENLIEEYEKMKKVWGLDEHLKISIPEKTLEEALEGVKSYVK